MIPEPWRCTWTKGCMQSISLLDGRDDELCYYHDKLRRGFLDPRDAGLDRSERSAPHANLSPTAERDEIRKALRNLGAPKTVLDRYVQQLMPAGIRGSDVVSDEQHEIVQVLGKLGAPARQIREAITKTLPAERRPRRRAKAAS